MPEPDDFTPLSLAVARWLDVVKPEMRHEAQPYGPNEPPEDKLERLRHTVWNETLVIGPELGKKLDAIAGKTKP
jgi:hypothetical protein